MKNNNTIKISVSISPELAEVLLKDSKRCLRTPEQQIDALLTEYYEVGSTQLRAFSIDEPIQVEVLQ